MPAKVGHLVIDVADPERLASFWCGFLAVSVDTTIGDGEFLVLSPTEDGLTVGFQREPKTRKNRLHLDLVVDDLDAATAEIDELGGQWLEPGKTRELEGFRWRCMADPEGNEFDIDVLPQANSCIRCEARRQQNAIHVGHSTGGGEVAHYLARHGESRVAKAAMISAVPR